MVDPRSRCCLCHCVDTIPFCQSTVHVESWERMFGRENSSPTTTVSCGKGREQLSWKRCSAPPPALVWLRCYIVATVFVHREHRSLQEGRTADQSDGREARETKETRQSFQNKDTQQCQNQGEGRKFVYYVSTFSHTHTYRRLVGMSWHR